MKQKIIMLVAFFAIATLAQASPIITGIEIPDVVLNAFKAKYPTATDVDWEKDGNEYEAEFEMDNRQYEATFTHTGTWVETETEITEAELPAVVATNLKAKFSGAKIKEIEKIENANGTFYEIELKVKQKREEVTYNSAGDIVPNENE